MESVEWIESVEWNAFTVILIAFQDSYFKIVVYAVLICLKRLKLLKL